MNALSPLPQRPATANIRIRSIPANANPTPINSTDKDDGYDEFDFIRDEFTVERLRALSGSENLNEVQSLEIEVDTSSQSIAHLGEVLPQLVTLKLTNSRVESFRDLGTKLRNLKILWVTRCGIRELDGIVALSGLQELYIAFNDIADLSPLALHENLTVLDLESNNVGELDQIEQLGTCNMLRDLTLDGNPISKRKAYRRIVGSLIPQLESLDYTEVSTKERRTLDDEVLAKLRRKCKDSADQAASPMRGSPHHAIHSTKLGKIVSNNRGPGSPAGKKRSGSFKRGDLPGAVSELQMVAEGIKWGTSNGTERAKSATGTPRPRRQLPRRPYSSSDHVELSSQLSQYKWHRKHSGRSAHMLELLEEIGVEENNESSSSSALTIGTNVTFVGNPIMAMRKRRLAIGDAPDRQITLILDEGERQPTSTSNANTDILFRSRNKSSSSIDEANIQKMEYVKHDLRTWDLDAAVAKLRARAGRSAPSSAASTPKNIGATASKTKTSAADEISQVGSQTQSKSGHGVNSIAPTKPDILIMNEDCTSPADLTVADNITDSSVADLSKSKETKAHSPGPTSLFTTRKHPLHSNSDKQQLSSRKSSSHNHRKSGHSSRLHDRSQHVDVDRLPHHDHAEVCDSDGEEHSNHDAAKKKSNYQDYEDGQLVSMLKKKPKKVPELQTKEDFRNFFEGCTRERMEKLLSIAYSKHEDSSKRIVKRLQLLEGVLT